MGPRNHVRWGPDPPIGSGNYDGKGAAHCRELCKKAEPIEIPFGLWIRMGPRKHAFDGVHTGEICQIMIELSMFGGDAAFFSNYFDHVSLLSLMLLFCCCCQLLQTHQTF